MILGLNNAEHVRPISKIHHHLIIHNIFTGRDESLKPGSRHKPVKPHSSYLIIHDPTDLPLLSHQHHRILGGVDLRPAGGCPGFALRENITHRYRLIVILDNHTSIIIQPHPFHELKKRIIRIIIDNINSLIKFILINFIPVVNIIHKIIVSLYSPLNLILIKTINVYIYDIINSISDVI